MQQIRGDEINIGEIFNFLVSKKFLIAGLTFFVTVIAFIYAFNQTPIYRASSSFTSPTSASIMRINLNAYSVSHSKNSVFTEFLNTLSSNKFQKKVFLEGNFLTLFNADNNPINNIDEFVDGVINSVRIIPPNTTQRDKDFGFLNEQPYSVVMEGKNAVSISEYLNSLIIMVNSKTIADIIKLSELNISKRLEAISIERDQLLGQAEKKRFSKILRIKEEDGQKIRQINDQIDRARYKAKENRLNQIMVLTDSVKLAKSLGIIENNFKLINDDGANSDLTIAIGESKDLPEWYLYGEKALIQRVELLKNRKSDDPYITELVTLNNQLNEVQNNNVLETLEARQDDSPFVAGIIELDMEKDKLESLILDLNGVNSMNLSQISLPKKSPISPNKRMIVLIAFFGSFMMSIFLIAIMGALNSYKKADA